MKRFLIVPLLICICTFGLVSCKPPETPSEPPPAQTVPAQPFFASAKPDPNPFVNEITVTWKASDDDGGSPVLGFKVGICEGEFGENECVHFGYDKFEWVKIPTSAKEDSTVIKASKNFDYLDARKTYTIRVRSYNAIGDSPCFWISKASSCTCQG